MAVAPAQRPHFRQAKTFRPIKQTTTALLPTETANRVCIAQSRSRRDPSRQTFGLFDMHGNVREWVEDCWHENYDDAPSDGSAWISGDCSRRVIRGGSWFMGPNQLRSAARTYETADSRKFNYSFRVAGTLTF